LQLPHDPSLAKTPSEAAQAKAWLPQDRHAPRVKAPLQLGMNCVGGMVGARSPGVFTGAQASGDELFLSSAALD
jgi:hypothetical protein